MNTYFIRNDIIYLNYDYDTTINKEVSNITGSDYNPYLKRWGIVLKEYNLSKVLDLLEKYSFCEKEDTVVKYSHKMLNFSHIVDDVTSLNTKYEPRWYQLENVVYNLKHKRTICGDLMGYGKTFSASLTVEYANLFPCLVITPASVKYQFAESWDFLFNNNRTAVIESNPPKKRPNNWDADVVVINYDILGKLVDKGRRGSGGKVLKDLVLKFPQLAKTKWKSVIIDELHFCFHYNTEINTDIGVLKIGDIVENNINCNVLSFNEKSGNIELKQITDYICTPLYERMVKVTFEDGTELLCTENHKIFTKNGYINAKNLKKGNYAQKLRMVWSGVQCKKEKTKVLWETMCGYEPNDAKGGFNQNLRMVRSEIQCRGKEKGAKVLWNFMCGFGSKNSEGRHDEKLRMVQPRVRGEKERPNVLWNFMCNEMEIQSAGLCSKNAYRIHSYEDERGENEDVRERGVSKESFRKNEEEQPNKKQENKGKNIKRIKKNKTQASSSRRKWSFNYPADKVKRRYKKYGAKSSYGVCCSSNKENKGRIFNAKSLQNRYCNRRKNDSYRSRWKLTQQPEGKRERFEERQGFKFVRVESVEILKQNSFGEHRHSDRRNTKVYCLGVSDNDNFYANGILVHNCKNAKAARSKAVAKITKDVEYIFALTGTAIESKPSEAINLFKILRQFDKIASSTEEYKYMFCDARRGYNGRLDASGASSLFELNKRMRESCYIRHDGDAVKLPPLVQTIINTPLSNKKEYLSALTDIYSYVESVEGEDGVEKLSMAESLKLYNILMKLSIEGKMKAIEQYLDDWKEGSDEKLVVFGVHRDPLIHLADKYHCKKIIGGVSSKNKNKIAKEFAESDEQFLFVNIESGGVGVDSLQIGCNHMLGIELPWNPSKLSQMVSRLHRGGQEETVFVNFMLAMKGIDKYIWNVLEGKESVTSVVNKGVDIELVENSLKNIAKNMIENFAA